MKLENKNETIDLFDFSYDEHVKKRSSKVDLENKDKETIKDDVIKDNLENKIDVIKKNINVFDDDFNSMLNVRFDSNMNTVNGKLKTSFDKWKNNDDLKKMGYNKGVLDPSKWFKDNYNEVSLKESTTGSFMGFSKKIEKPYLVIDIENKEGNNKAYKYIEALFSKISKKLSIENIIESNNYVKTKTNGRHIYCKVDELDFDTKDPYKTVCEKLSKFFGNKEEFKDNGIFIEIKKESSLISWFTIDGSYQFKHKKSFLKINRGLLASIIGKKEMKMSSKNLDNKINNSIGIEVLESDLTQSKKRSLNYFNSIYKHFDDDLRPIIDYFLIKENPLDSYNDGWLDCLMKAHNLTCFYSIKKGIKLNKNQYPLFENEYYEILLDSLLEWSLKGNYNGNNRDKLRNEIENKLKSFDDSLKINFDFLKAKNDLEIKEADVIFDDKFDGILDYSKYYDRFALVNSSNRILDLKEADCIEDATQSDSFNRSFKKKPMFSILNCDTEYEDLNIVKITPANLIKEHPRFKNIKGTCYIPALGNKYQQLIGKNYLQLNYNMFKKNSIAKNNITFENLNDELKFKMDNIKILIETWLETAIMFKKERDMLITWFDSIISKPHLMTKTLIVLSSPKQGLGKSSIVDMFLRTLGDGNSKQVGVSDIINGFSGGYDRTLVNHLSDIELSKKDSMKFNSKIKPLITDSKISIHRKGKTQSKEDNYTNWIITTNNPKNLNTENEEHRRLIFIPLAIDKNGKSIDQKAFKELLDINLKEKGRSDLTHKDIFNLFFKGSQGNDDTKDDNNEGANDDYVDDTKTITRYDMIASVIRIMRLEIKVQIKLLGQNEPTLSSLLYNKNQNDNDDDLQMILEFIKTNTENESIELSTFKSFSNLLDTILDDSRKNKIGRFLKNKCNIKKRNGVTVYEYKNNQPIS